MNPKSPKGPAPAGAHGAAVIKAQHQQVFLTTRASEQFGGEGVFVDLDPDALGAADPDLLVKPTPDQLARRRR